MNNKYTIVVGSPLLRAGLSIETECSENYVVPVLRKLFALIREFNEGESASKSKSSKDDKMNV